MLRNIALGRFVAGTGFLYDLDPRTKLLSLIALMMAALSNRGLAPVTIFAGLVAVVAVTGRLPLGILLRNLRSFAWLIGITAALHLFMTPGVPRWVIPHVGLVITDAGIFTAALFSLRLAAVVTAASTPAEGPDGARRRFHRRTDPPRPPSGAVAGATVSVRLRPR